jgi:Lipase (class 3)
MPFAAQFNPTEAKELIAIIAALEGATPPLPLPAIPASWGTAPLFDSPVLGAWDNKWQLWKNTSNQFALVIRGTVDTTGSIFEDLMAVMIPATGTLPVGSVSLPYKLAENPQAAVHFGFLLGMGVLLFDANFGILAKLDGLPAGAEVFVAGHSQGAAIATLCRSFLEYSNLMAAKKFSYKSYVYAQPKPGNDHYGREFERLASNPGTGFTITNSQDWVPQVPLTLQLVKSLNDPNPLDFLTGGFVFKLLAEGMETLRSHLMEVHLAKHVPQMKALEDVLKKQNFHAVSASTGISLETVVKPTLNFINCGSAISLSGTPGTNPNDPKDFFWQHHAAMYHKLLCSEFP